MVDTGNFENVKLGNAEPLLQLWYGNRVRIPTPRNNEKFGVQESVCLGTNSKVQTEQKQRLAYLNECETGFDGSSC